MSYPVASHSALALDHTTWWQRCLNKTLESARQFLPTEERAPTLERRSDVDSTITGDQPRAAVAMSGTYQVQPPEPFSFSRPNEWPKWTRRFERFRVASGLGSKGEEVQVNTLLYAMGDDADDILRSFQLSAADQKKYSEVKGRFDQHFVKKRNVIFERARFNRRKQEEGETVDAFVTDLYALAEYCSYAGLHDEMIRDRLVVGLLSASLSEKLQLDPDLAPRRVLCGGCRLAPLSFSYRPVGMTVTSAPVSIWNWTSVSLSQTVTTQGLVVVLSWLLTAPRKESEPSSTVSTLACDLHTLR